MAKTLTRVQTGEIIGEEKGNLIAGNEGEKGIKKSARNKEERQNDFLTAFVANVGLIYKSCEMSGVRFKTIREWEKDEKFKEKYEEAKTKVNEKVEASLISKFGSNTPVPEIFWLKSRDPRYSQKVTLEGNQDAPIIITHSQADLEKVTKAIIEVMKKE